MDYQMSVQLRQAMAQRAHLYGARSIELGRQADALAASAGPPPASISEANEAQLRAYALAQEAHQARRRYFRELEAVDLLGGHSGSPFAALG